MWNLSLEKCGLRFPPKCVTPTGCGYFTDLDVTGLVALILFGDVRKCSGQGHFEDTSVTRPGRVRDMSGREHIFRQVWERT